MLFLLYIFYKFGSPLANFGAGRKAAVVADAARWSAICKHEKSSVARAAAQRAVAFMGVADRAPHSACLRYYSAERP